METVNATRMNLLLKRQEARDVSTGAELLRNKRDVLLREFFLVLKPLMTLRQALDVQSNQAVRSLVFALGLEGRERLNSFSFAAANPINLRIKYKNLLGLRILEVVIEPVTRMGQEGAGLIDTGLVIQDVKERFQEFLNLALKVLPEEIKLKCLGQEIKKTTRKINSLEKFVIPHLRSQVNFIQQTLEEVEREDIFRLKRLRKHLKGK